MSSRAIRALRGDPLLPPAIPDAIDEDETDDSDDDAIARPGVFAFMNDDESSEESDEEDSSLPSKHEIPDVSGESASLKGVKAVQASKDCQLEQIEAPEEEDLDALLAEFQVVDESNPIPDDSPLNRRPSPFDLILDGFESRHLDYDYVMRTSTTLAPQKNLGVQKRAVSFGPAHSDWRRPPRLVGGGIGMQSYLQHPRQLPWPYDTILNEDDGSVEWFTFVYSDTVERDMEDFRLIQQSGDLNALGMFLVHHPYVHEALMQYSTVLYQTNRIFEGMSLLKRCLYLFESSALASFWDRLGNASVCFMDYDQPENQQFFRAVFRLMQVSHISGLSRTSLATCRLLLALDPLRDPLAVLLILDRQALAVTYQAIDVSEQTATLQWMVNLVESNLIKLYYRDSSLPDDTVCSLLDLPNWAYSYPLALFLLAEIQRIDGHENVADTLKEKADSSLREAMLRFPSIIPLLLQNLDIDTTGRSFQRDWMKVLDFAEGRARSLKRQWQAGDDDSVNLSATIQTMERIGNIFVTDPSKQWAAEDVIQWFFDTLEALANSNGELPTKHPSSPCIMRYSNAKVSDFEARNYEPLPADADIMDPNVVAAVMAPMQAGRQRFLRNQPQQNLGALDRANGMRQQPAMFGPPRNAVDLDWPMAEVFWRSFLPWNYIDGLPPPPRR